MKRKELLDYIINSVESIADCKCILTYHNNKNKYDAEYTYNTFEVKGRKKWQFGVWILNSNDKKSYRIYLFGEHKWYSDVFKPSRTAMSYEVFEIKKTTKKLPIPCTDEDGYKAPNSLWNFGWAIADVAKSSLLSRIKYHWKGGCKTLFNFVLGDWVFYTIKEPLTEWYKDYGMIVPLTIAKVLYKIRFGKKVDININSMREFFSPKWEFQIVYNTKDSDEIFDMYCLIHSKKPKIGDTEIHYRYLFLPKWLYNGYVNVIDTANKKDRRGFYYKLELAK